MSVESLAVVLHHSQASGTDKLVLVGIANHDGDGGAWPAVPTLARYANVSDRTVQRSIEKLGRMGEIVVYTSAGGHRGTPDHKRPNRYEILVKCPDGCDRSSNHRVKRVDNPPPAGSESVDKALFDPVTPTSPGDAHVTPPGDAHVTRTILMNHPQNHPALASHSPAENRSCWACGQQVPGNHQYCLRCRNSGMDNDLINCTSCGCVTRRQHAGQQNFTCTRCQPQGGKAPWEM